MAVLLAMGLGLALPYLALSMTPALQRLMPRPGPWMDRLRQFLAFPMYASAVWMIWVLTQQTGPDGVIYALGGMILIAFAIWLLRLGSRHLARRLAAPRRRGRGRAAGLRRRAEARGRAGDRRLGLGRTARASTSTAGSAFRARA